MNRPNLRLLVYIVFFTTPLIPFISKAQNQQEDKLDRLMAFALLSGNIRYFSPTDLVDSMNLSAGWENIMREGTKIAREAKNERLLADSLIKIFKPLEPSLSVKYDQTILTSAPSLVVKDLVVGRQHRGLELYSGTNRPFRSYRTNRRSLGADMYLNYFTLMSIKVPEGKEGKPFTLKFSFKTEKNRNIKSFVKADLRQSFNLNPSDSIFIIQDSLPKDAQVFAIKFGITDDIGHLTVNSTNEIKIDGQAFSIEELTDLQTSNYKNDLVLRIMENDPKLFLEENKIGDTLNMKLSKHIEASFPLAVYADEQTTYPVSTHSYTSYPYKRNNGPSYFDLKQQEDLDVRLANVMSIWTAFHIAYVYHPFDEEQDLALLRNTLKDVLDGKTLEDYDFALNKMMHAYQDAHIFYHNESFRKEREFTAPITLIYLNDGFYIKRIHDDSLKNKLQIGDKLLEIEGKSIKEIWKKQQFYATGSEANIINRAGVFGLFSGPENSIVNFKVIDYKSKKIQEIQTIRNYKHQRYALYTALLDRQDNRMLNDSTYYFNLSENPLTDTLLNFINDPTKHIIFDVRGYLTLDSEQKGLIRKLITDTVVQNNMSSLQILSPKTKWFTEGPQVTIPENQHPKAKFYFLIAEATQSAPETFLDIIKYWKIGTLIGKHTAGANGEINIMNLPGNITTTFSGVMVKNSDGSTHHLNGISPDIEVDYTLDDVIHQRDPYILKALEIIASGKGIVPHRSK